MYLCICLLQEVVADCEYEFGSELISPDPVMVLKSLLGGSTLNNEFGIKPVFWIRIY